MCFPASTFGHPGLGEQALPECEVAPRIALVQGAQGIPAEVGERQRSQGQQGHCGQAPWYENDTMYCEYHADPARCEPFLSCSSPDEIICAEQDLICDCDGGGCPVDVYTDGQCTVECDADAHCSQGFGWPADYCCANNACEPC